MNFFFEEPVSMEAIGNRLKTVREILGLSQGDFATDAKIAHNTYNQYENGKKRPSVENAILLCQKYNLTLDYIYRGDPSGLNYSFAEKISKLNPNKS